MSSGCAGFRRLRRRSCSLPNEDSIIRLIGAVLLEANDDWQLQHRYMQTEGMAELNTGLSDKLLLETTPRAA
jgi:transposase-like protein